MKVGMWLGGLATIAAVAGVGYHLLVRPAATQPIHPVSVVRTASSASPPTATTPPVSTVPTGSAPPFQVASLNAGTVTVPDGRPTVVYFMSAGCGSCISGEQQLAQLATRTPAAVQWLSLDVDPGYDTRTAVLSMAHYTGAHWPQAFGTNAIINAYHVTQLDMVAVIAKNGQLLYDGALPSNTQLQTLIAHANA